MVKLIVAATFAVAMVMGAGQVQAQMNCTQVGNNTFCNSPGGNVTCIRVGNNTFCN